MHTVPTKTVLIDTTQLGQIVPVCSRTIQRWIKAGRFPKPIQQGRKSLWPANQIDAWIEANGGAAQH